MIKTYRENEDYKISRLSLGLRGASRFQSVEPYIFSFYESPFVEFYERKNL